MLLGAGGNEVDIDHVNIASVGGANDGREYFVVSFAAPTNILAVRNSSLGGLPSNKHVHGINIGANTMVETVVQNSVFNFFNESISGITNNKVMLMGNMSFNTNNGGISVDLKGAGRMVYVGNFWDVPPTALLPFISN